MFKLKNKDKPVFSTLLVVFFLLILSLSIIKFQSIKRRYILLKKTITSIVFSNKINNQVIKNRKNYINSYYRKQEFLESYELNKYIILSLINPDNSSIKINNTDLFLTLDNIKKKINILNNDSDENKVIKIHDFIKKYSYHNHSLFSSDELHNPTRYFSIYGNGLCDDAARNFDYLANIFGFNSRVWHLEGHVVADVFYNNNWHIIDPDLLGIVRYDNQIANIDQMIKLAAKNTFSKEVNRFYLTTNDNYIKTDNYKSENTEEPYLIFFSHEKKIFLDQIFMFSTSENPENTNPDKKDFIEEYNKGMGNIIREIPLSKINNKLIITDYFPIVAVFIKIPNNVNMSKNPNIKLDTSKTTIPIYPQPQKLKTKNYKYLDYSIVCKNLEKFPSRKIKIKNLSFLKKIDATLLIINIYSKKNMLIKDHKWKNQLKKHGLKIEFNP